MKIYKNWLIFSSALVINLAVTGKISAQEAVVQVSPTSEPDPLVVKGTSGGEKSSDCGNITAAPNQILQVTESIPYLRLSVESTGQPTLLIEGPQKRRFCVLADSNSGEKPEISGYWEAGKYAIYVGDRAQGQHPYTLSISRKKASSK